VQAGEDGEEYFLFVLGHLAGDEALEDGLGEDVVGLARSIGGGSSGPRTAGGFCKAKDLARVRPVEQHVAHGAQLDHAVFLFFRVGDFFEEGFADGGELCDDGAGHRDHASRVLGSRVAVDGQEVAEGLAQLGVVGGVGVKVGYD
jgi:hypothetical protein